MSCMVMMSPSMPTISEICITLRVRSDRRLTCTTMLMALAICCRMARSGRSSPGHRDHGLEPAQRNARRVRVQRGQRAVMTGVHGLEHVHGFGAPDLAHDDAVGTHAERVDEEQPLRDF